MLDVKNILLSQDELERCMEFSQRSAPNQQAIEFGQRSTKARGTREIARDNLIGKIAEVAFSKMMRKTTALMCRWISTIIRADNGTTRMPLSMDSELMLREPEKADTGC